MSINTPTQVAQDVYWELAEFPVEPRGADLRALMVKAIEADRAQRAQIHQDWRDDQDMVRDAHEVIVKWEVHDGEGRCLFGSNMGLDAEQAVGMFQGIGEASL